MSKTAFVLLCPLLLAACATPPSGLEAASEDQGYFADATDCYRAAIIKTQVGISVGGFSNKDISINPTNMAIDIPLSHDPGTFTNCMVHAGHQPPKADPSEYLEMSSRCLSEAQGAENADEAYGRCIRRGGISVEIIDKRSE